MLIIVCSKNSNFVDVPIRLLMKIFLKMVIPKLLYCSEVWGPYLLGKITYFEMLKSKIFKLTNVVKKFYLKFCEQILRVLSKSTNVAVYAELCRVLLILPVFL